MVLPAPAPDDPQGAPRPPWIERVVDVVGASRRGVLLLARAPNDGPLGALTRALLRAHPDLVVTADPAVVERCGDGAVVIYAPDPAHAPGLNLARPLFAQRALRVVLWARPATIRALARDAPDFFDWISHRVEVPWAVAPFAVQGLRASLALGVGVDWRGPHLEAAIRALEPAAPIVRVDPAIEWERLVAQVNDAPPGAWLVFDVGGREERLRRVRWAGAACGREARLVVRGAPKGVRGWMSLHAHQGGLNSQERTLTRRFAQRAGLVAAALDLEPAAPRLLARMRRLSAGRVLDLLRGAAEPGAALATLYKRSRRPRLADMIGHSLNGPIVRALSENANALLEWRATRWIDFEDHTTRSLDELRRARRSGLSYLEQRSWQAAIREWDGFPDVAKGVLAMKYGLRDGYAAFHHGLYLFRQSDFERALDSLRTANREMSSQVAPDRSELALVRRAVGETLIVLGRLTEAERLLLDPDFDAFDPDSVDLALARTRLWLAYGLPETAARFIPSGTPQAPWYRRIGLWAGEIALLRADFKAALAWFDKDYVEPYWVWHALARRGRALAQAGLGDFEAARSTIAEVTRECDALGAEARCYAALGHLAQGEILTGAGHYGGASSHISTARDLYTSLFHERHHGVGLARLALGRLHLRTARYGDARAELELARSILEEVVRPPRPDAVRARVELVRLDRIERVADAQATRARLVAEAALLADSLGEEHPEVVALRAEAAAP